MDVYFRNLGYFWYLLCQNWKHLQSNKPWSSIKLFYQSLPLTQFPPIDPQSCLLIHNLTSDHEQVKFVYLILMIADINLFHLAFIKHQPQLGGEGGEGTLVHSASHIDWTTKGYSKDIEFAGKYCYSFLPVRGDGAIVLSSAKSYK